MCCGISVVKSITERIITAVYLTVSSVCKKYVFMDTVFYKVTGGSTVRLINGSNTVGIFAFCFCFFKIEVITPTVNTVLKVEEDIGATTELDVHSIGSNRSIILIVCCNCSSSRTFFGSCIDKAVHCTCSKCKVKYVRRSKHISTVIKCCNGHIRGTSVGNHLVLCTESDLCRMNESYVYGTYNSTVKKHIDCNCTELTVRLKYTVSYRTERSIGKSPGYVLGDLCGMSTSVCTESIYSYLGGRSVEGIFRAEVSMVKCTVCNCSGNNHQSVGYRTNCTVAAGVTNYDLIGTLELSCVCSRSAAVELDSCNTTEINHYLSLFSEGKTRRIGLLVTVSKHKDNVTVFLDTNGRTRILVGIIQTCNDLSVPYEEEVSCNSFYNVFRILAECTLLTYHCGTVLHDSEELIRVTHAVTVDVNTFHYEGTGGLTGRNIVVSSIGGCDYVVAALFCSSVCLFNNRCFAPNTGVIIVMVVSLDLYVGV